MPVRHPSVLRDVFTESDNRSFYVKKATMMMVLRLLLVHHVVGVVKSLRPSSNYAHPRIAVTTALRTTTTAAETVNNLICEDEEYQNHATTVVSSISAADQVNLLSRHPSICWDESTSLQKARKKLRPRHKSLFDATRNESDDSGSSSSNYDSTKLSLALFDEFASVLCQTGVMPRKEVFETWSAAIYMHSEFFKQSYSYAKNTNTVSEMSDNANVRRVCDVAGGHGLLSWALLVLDDAERKNLIGGQLQNDKDNRGQSELPPPLTALCVDRRMPSSAEAIQDAMIDHWPHLEDRFDFVEGWLEQIVFHPTCLIASVHACGGLSDTVVSSSVYSKAPVALVPCCHSRKKKALLRAPLEFARAEYNEIISFPKDKAFCDLADRLDVARETALRNAGFNVTTQFLPKIFTSKNRLIMASPTLEGRAVNGTTAQIESSTTHQLGRMPQSPLGTTKTKKDNSRTYHLEKFSIPCEDSSVARKEINKLSGRLNAKRRANARHRKKCAESPEFDISMWLPQPSTLQSSSKIEGRHADHKVIDAPVVTEDALSNLASSIAPTVKCVAVKLGSEFVHSSTGRRAQTFRLTYSYDNDVKQQEGHGDGSNIGVPLLSDEVAKAIHATLYDSVPTIFPGAKCR